MKGEKTVAFCDRHCNIIAAFVRAPANRNETVVLKTGIEQLVLRAKAVGFCMGRQIQAFVTEIRIS